MWRTPPFDDYRPIIRASFWLLLYGPLSLAVFIPVLVIESGKVSESIGFYLMLTLFSPIFVLPTLVLAIPLAILAARNGWAGLASTTMAGTILGGVAGLLWGFSAILWLFAMFGCIYGGVFWMVLRRYSPEAMGLAARDDQSSGPTNTQ
jgi:hypothetical protein